MHKSKKKTFTKEYVEYWKARVGNPIDGSKVADDDVLKFYIAQMKIRKSDRVLDLGCGYGRLFPVIYEYSSHIIGIDVSCEILSEAAKFEYGCLLEGKFEHTHLPDDYIDKIISWATFDVVEQEKALIEANRILKQDGLLLVTGKNFSYRIDDNKAFTAERNAKLKDFPNHFTDIERLISLAKEFGFAVIKAYAFERRGDFGENMYHDILTSKLNKFYEYLLILRKVCAPYLIAGQLAYEYSEVAMNLAKRHGFKNDVKAFFEWHKNHEHDD